LWWSCDWCREKTHFLRAALKLTASPTLKNLPGSKILNFEP
jgi:hypothetical protein